MGRSQDLSYFHKEFIMPGHYGKMMKDKKMKKGKKVVGKRKKLDMDKDGKLTAKDFAMLRKGKKKKA